LHSANQHLLTYLHTVIIISLSPLHYNVPLMLMMVFCHVGATVMYHFVYLSHICISHNSTFHWSLFSLSTYVC